MKADQEAAAAFPVKTQMGDDHNRDSPGEAERGGRIAQAQPLRRKIARGGAKCEGEEEGGPVEELSPQSYDGVDSRVSRDGDDNDQGLAET